MNNCIYLREILLIVLICLLRVKVQGKYEISPDWDSKQLLIFATLEGSLIAIQPDSGKVQWKIEDEPVIKSNTSEAIVPLFLPDPRDGSLYLISNERKTLKKLPFTIPQLVALSPCRNSDGILYTGKKKDTWFKLDPETGDKHSVLGWDTLNPTCSIETDDAVFIGKSEYEIKMVDSNDSNRKWNVTYSHYSASTMSEEDINNYGRLHFTSTSTGRLVSIDLRSRDIMWNGDLGSPVVAVYTLNSDGLVLTPFTSIANHAIDYLTNDLFTNNDFFNEAVSYRVKLLPTIYIGDHDSGLYALPSMVKNKVMPATTPLLIDGPDDHSRLRTEMASNQLTSRKVRNLIYQGTVRIGHYTVPEFSDLQFWIPQVPTQSHAISKDPNPTLNSFSPMSIRINDPFPPLYNPDTSKSTQNINLLLKTWGKQILNCLNQQDHNILKLTLIVVTGSIMTVFWYIRFRIPRQSLAKSIFFSTSVTSGRSTVTAYSEELSNGLVRVGKITFHPNQLLGKGCEGTFVYRGEFDNRRVAVKRILPECFTFADREVELLRESDTHPNVIRYYCTEQDRMFRYIALELCQATLSDYVEGTCDRRVITPLEILIQSTSGLRHLHSLDIVHRDIKPHNVLLSMPDGQKQVKAMISDFGLCKKLQVGKVSFSRRSGVTGTDGWIAPEMLTGSDRTTCAVDIFSLGCLYYYVLSNGQHPFGDTLKRQINILSGDYNLSQLNGEEWQTNLQKILVGAMISSNPEHRPSCEVLLNHPTFWSLSKILSFFQDVSDIIQKVDQDSYLHKHLELGGTNVVKVDWTAYLDEALRNDLESHRSYRGESVQDLLRALRNKKHHYQESSLEVQRVLGDIPDAFTLYWITRFPLLLSHVWFTMQCFPDKNFLKCYYSTNYEFRSRHYKRMMGSGGYSTISISTNEEILPGCNQIFLNNSKMNKKPSSMDGKIDSLNKDYVKISKCKLKSNHRARKNSKRNEPLIWTVRE